MNGDHVVLILGRLLGQPLYHHKTFTAEPLISRGRKKRFEKEVEIRVLSQEESVEEFRVLEIHSRNNLLKRTVLIIVLIGQVKIMLRQKVLKL